MFHLMPVGKVVKSGEKTWIEISDEYTDAMLGIGDFSHIYVFYWFHENDAPEKRQTLQVHPRGDERNPLTGVFATHSPLRPNLIAMTLCRISAVNGNLIEIEDIDALDGSPVIDIKCYIPESVPDVRLPDWV